MLRIEQQEWLWEQFVVSTAETLAEDGIMLVRIFPPGNRQPINVKVRQPTASVDSTRRFLTGNWNKTPFGAGLDLQVIDKNDQTTVFWLLEDKS